MGKLDEELATYSTSLGVDLFGVADLTPAQDFILIQGGKQIGAYKKAVSVGFRLLDPIVDELYRHEDPSVIFSYRGLYNSVNQNLDRTALLIAKKIQNKGFKAYPIPASQTINERKLEAVISHKLVANLAGLGWIGKSCLLVTPKFGPRVRWATILTDAPLETNVQISNRCGECMECVNICPPKAFTGVPFDSSEPRAVRFRAHLCRDYTERRSQQLGEGICGLCVYVCPYGKNK